MKVNLNEKQAEALKRMKTMNLLPNVITDFEKHNVVYYSELSGILYWISNNPKWQTFINEFESKYKTLVYHAEFSRLAFGDCLTLFYVSDYKEEWEQDKEDLRQGIACTYVWNISDPVCSEFGYISFAPSVGGIVRTG